MTLCRERTIVTNAARTLPLQCGDVICEVLGAALVEFISGGVCRRSTEISSLTGHAAIPLLRHARTRTQRLLPRLREGKVPL